MFSRYNRIWSLGERKASDGVLVRLDPSQGLFSRSRHAGPKELAMPLTDQIIVLGICAVFIGFGAVLAWGEIQTRNLKPPR